MDQLRSGCFELHMSSLQVERLVIEMRRTSSAENSAWQDHRGIHPSAEPVRGIISGALFAEQKMGSKRGFTALTAGFVEGEGIEIK